MLLAIEEYESLVAGRPNGVGSGGAFLGRLDAVKQRHGGGVEVFEPARMDFKPADPFARRRAPKK